MADRIKYRFFSIVPIDPWAAAIRGTPADPYLSIVPSAGDVQLRLSVPELDAVQIHAAQWVAHTAEFNRKRFRPVYAAACGDFAGYTVRYETDNEWFAYWALCSGDRAIEVIYVCPKIFAGRDEDVISGMLASLRKHDDLDSARNSGCSRPVQ